MKCEQCGYCCSHAWVPLAYDTMADGFQGVCEWLEARGETIEVRGKHLYLRLDHDCQHLSPGGWCVIYDKRPLVCAVSKCPRPHKGEQIVR